MSEGLPAVSSRWSRQASSSSRVAKSKGQAAPHANAEWKQVRMSQALWKPGVASEHHAQE